MLNKTLSDMKRDYGGGQGFWYSVFGKGLAKGDLDTLRNYNQALKICDEEHKKFLGIPSQLSVAGKRMAVELKAGRTSIEEIEAAEKAATASTIGLQAATVALNAAISLGISLLITGAIKLIDELVHHQEHLIEKSEEAAGKIKELSDNFKDTSKTTKDIAQRFAELSQGVDSLTGKNISLTTDEYEEFLSISNQLAELFPSLTRHYDENGNAIVNLSGDVDTIVGSLNSLVEAQRQLANQEIAEQLPDLYKGIKAQGDAYDSQIARLEQQIKKTEEIFSRNDGVVWRFNPYSYGAKSADTVKEVEKAIERAGYQASFSGLDNSISIPAFAEMEADELEAAKKRVVDEIMTIPEIAGYVNKSLDKLNRELVSAKEKNKANWNGLLSGLTAWAQSEDSYIALSDDMQALVNNAIGNIDFSSMDFSSLDDVKNYVTNGILEPILEIQQDSRAKQALTKLFELKESDLPVGEIQSLAKNYLDIIAEVLDKNPAEVKLMLGITDSDIDAQVRVVRSKIQKVWDDTAGDFVSEDLISDFTPEELALAIQVATSIPAGTTVSWDEFVKKMDEAKTSAQQAEQAFIDMGNGIKYTKEQYQEMFGLGEDWGNQVDSGEEYAAVLKTISTHTNAADKAIQEYIKEGKISQSTVDSLTSANKDYAKAIVYTKNGIELKIETLKDLVDQYVKVHTAQLQNQIDEANSALLYDRDSLKIDEQLLAASENNPKYEAALQKRINDLKTEIPELEKSIKEWQGQKDYYDNLVAGLGTEEKGTKSSTTLKSHEKNTNRYNLQADWLKDQENAIDKLKEDYNKINTQLEKAIELGDEEQIRILSGKLNDKSKEIQDLYAKGASEGRVRFDDMQSQLWDLVPQLKGKKFEDITEQDWEQVEKWLDDNITAQNNIKIDMENANSDLKDANKDAIDAANNLKSTVTELHSNMSSFYEAFGTESGDINRTFSKGWADEADNQIETVKSEFEALNEIFDKGIEEQQKKIDKIDFHIDLLDENDYAGKMDLIAEKSQLNAENAAKVSAEIDRIKSEFEDSLLPADEYNKRMEDLEDQYNDCVKSGKEFEDTLKDIAQEQIDNVVSVENEVKSYLEDYMSMVEDNAQKEIDAAEKSADAKKKALDKAKEALQDYQDQLEKQWAAEDARDARREKLDERNEKSSERSKLLTAAATGDLEALSKVQDLDKEIADIDKELQEDIIKDIRDSLKDFIDGQIDALDKQADKLDEQLDTMKKQLEEQQKTNEELLKGESAYALVHSLMAGESVNLNGKDVDMAAIRSAVDTKNGNAFSYGYDSESAEWQKNLSESLASVANLTALNKLAEGKFTLENGTIILGDGTVFDSALLSQPTNDNIDTLIPLTTDAVLSAIGVDSGGKLTDYINSIGANIAQNMGKLDVLSQTQKDLANRIINEPKEVNLNFDSLINVVGNVTEDIVPKIKEIAASTAMSTVLSEFAKGISAKAVGLGSRRM